MPMLRPAVFAVLVVLAIALCGCVSGPAQGAAPQGQGQDTAPQGHGPGANGGTSPQDGPSLGGAAECADETGCESAGTQTEPPVSDGQEKRTLKTSDKLTTITFQRSAFSVEIGSKKFTQALKITLSGYVREVAQEFGDGRYFVFEGGNLEWTVSENTFVKGIYCDSSITVNEAGSAALSQLEAEGNAGTRDYDPFVIEYEEGLASIGKKPELSLRGYVSLMVDTKDEDMRNENPSETGYEVFCPLEVYEVYYAEEEHQIDPSFTLADADISNPEIVGSFSFKEGTSSNGGVAIVSSTQPAELVSGEIYYGLLALSNVNEEINAIADAGVWDVTYTINLPE